MNNILFFDLFAITLLLFLGISGYKRGFLIEIGRIVGLIFTLWLSMTYYVDFAEILQQKFSLNPSLILFVSFSIIFIVTLIVTRVIIELIDQIIGIRKIRSFIRSLGFVLGVIKGIISIIIILWVFELLPFQHWTEILYKESRIANITRAIRDKTIEYFRWVDPVETGKAYVKSKIDRDSTNQEVDE